MSNIRKALLSGSAISLATLAPETGNGNGPEHDNAIREVIDELRPAFKKYKGRETTLNDSQMAGMILSQSDELDESAWINLMAVTEDAIAKDGAAVSGLLGDTSAERVAHDPALNRALSKSIEIKEEKQMVPLAIACILRKSYTKDEFLSFPRPGTVADDVKGTNEVADRYSRGTGKNRVTGSFWGDFARGTDEGVVCTVNLKGVKLAREKSPDTPADYVKLKGDTDGCDREQDKWDNRFRAVRDAITGGAKVVRQMFLIEEFKSVRLSVYTKSGKIIPLGEFLQDTKPEDLDRTSAPIVIEEIGGRRWEAFSINNFLAMKLDDCKDTYVDVVASNARGKQDGDEDEEGSIDDPKSAVQAVVGLASFFKSIPNVNAFKAILNRKGDSRDAVLLALRDLETEVRALTTAHKGRIDHLTEKETAAAEAADAAEKKLAKAS